MLKLLRELNWFQKLSILGIALIIFRNSFFFEFEMKGVYVSNAEEPTSPGMPGKGEKLYILANGKYTSTSMGEGTYKINGNKINLSSETEGWCLPLCRAYNIGRPKILLSGDWGYYMIKE